MLMLNSLIHGNREIVDRFQPSQVCVCVCVCVCVYVSRLDVLFQKDRNKENRIAHEG